MGHFDLEPLQEPELLQAFHVRRILFAVGALIGFGAFAGILAEDLAHSAWPGLSLLSAGMLGVLGIAFSMGLVIRAPPFSAMDIDSEGVRFARGRRSELNMNWNDPRFKLRLMSTSGVPGGISRGRPAYGLLGWRLFETVIPKAAFDQILDQARVNGLCIREEVSYTPGWVRHIVAPPPGKGMDPTTRP